MRPAAASPAGDHRPHLGAHVRPEVDAASAEDVLQCAARRIVELEVSFGRPDVPVDVVVLSEDAPPPGANLRHAEPLNCSGCERGDVCAVRRPVCSGLRVETKAANVGRSRESDRDIACYNVWCEAARNNICERVEERCKVVTLGGISRVYKEITVGAAARKPRV